MAAGSRPLVLPAKLCRASPICLRLFWQLARAAASRIFWTAGRSRPIRMAMIAITTSSSISVNPRRFASDTQFDEFITGPGREERNDAQRVKEMLRDVGTMCQRKRESGRRDLNPRSPASDAGGHSGLAHTPKSGDRGQGTGVRDQGGQ